MRTVLAGLMVAAAIGTAEADSLYRDSASGFALMTPTGWNADNKPDSDDVKLTLTSPNASESGALCNVTSSALGQTSGMTQDAINAKIQKGWVVTNMTEEALQLDPKAAILGRDRIDLGGVTAERAEINFVYPAKDGGRLGLTAFKLLAITPGHAFNLNCMSKPGSYNANRATFDRIMRSFVLTP